MTSQQQQQQQHEWQKDYRLYFKDIVDSLLRTAVRYADSTMRQYMKKSPNFMRFCAEVDSFELLFKADTPADGKADRPVHGVPGFVQDYLHDRMILELQKLDTYIRRRPGNFPPSQTRALKDSILMGEGSTEATLDWPVFKASIVLNLVAHLLNLIPLLGPHDAPDGGFQFRASEAYSSFKISSEDAIDILENSIGFMPQIVWHRQESKCYLAVRHYHGGSPLQGGRNQYEWPCESAIELDQKERKRVGEHCVFHDDLSCRPILYPSEGMDPWGHEGCRRICVTDLSEMRVRIGEKLIERWEDEDISGSDMAEQWKDLFDSYQKSTEETFDPLLWAAVRYIDISVRPLMEDAAPYKRFCEQVDSLEALLKTGLSLESNADGPSHSIPMFIREHLDRGRNEMINSLDHYFKVFWNRGTLDDALENGELDEDILHAAEVLSLALHFLLLIYNPADEPVDDIEPDITKVGGDSSKPTKKTRTNTRRPLRRGAVVPRHYPTDLIARSLGGEEAGVVYCAKARKCYIAVTHGNMDAMPNCWASSKNEYDDDDHNSRKALGLQNTNPRSCYCLIHDKETASSILNPMTDSRNHEGRIQRTWDQVTGRFWTIGRYLEHPELDPETVANWKGLCQSYVSGNKERDMP